MKSLLKLCALGGLLLCASGCLFKPTASQVSSYQLRAHYEQGACFGRCPVYALDLYQNGLLVYQGERFTDMPGTWEKVLTKPELNELVGEFSKVDFRNYPASYPSRVPDLAAITLAYAPTAGGQIYTISWKENRPEELNRLAELMRDLADAGGFTKVSDEIKKGPNILGQTVSLEAEEIIVHLEAGVNPQAWIIQYSKQNVQIKERITPNGNYYLILSDPNLMDTEELLSFLRQDESVISAQRNRQVTPRGRQ